MTRSFNVLGELGWAVILDRVYRGPLADPVTDEPIIGSDTTIWDLTLHRGDERIAVCWWPEDRLLQGHLAGWSRHTVGRLKRNLIALGRNAPPLGPLRG